MNDDPKKDRVSSREKAALLVQTAFEVGYTPSSLHRVTGLSRTSIWRLERGMLDPRRATICVLRLAIRCARLEQAAAGPGA